jgi:hypothetical protein
VITTLLEDVGGSGRRELRVSISVFWGAAMDSVGSAGEQARAVDLLENPLAGRPVAE